ncbi:Tn3 family transposase [Streptomyces sp. NPDC019396]|uniref:Tn3 family transposase n=1 Tax=Streptomyces sp. NPDC019396 TaxID=3154687 RepID=UPI0033D683BD
MLPLAGSLREGTVRASQILPVLAGQGRPSPLGRAVMQIGRLDRSAFLARYYHSELFRRKINTQLNRQESRHELARRIFYGQKGELRQRYKEGQEDQLSALGLVLNACVPWNSVYLQEMVNQLRAEGHHISDADLARLSPLGHDHIRMIGRFHFRLSPELAAGKLRPPAYDEGDRRQLTGGPPPACRSASSRRTCSCDTPQNAPIRRSPQPSSEAAAIASTRASSNAPTSALRSSSSRRIRNAGASPSNSTPRSARASTAAGRRSSPTTCSTPCCGAARAASPSSTSSPT